MNGMGMSVIKVKKKELLDKIIENRKAHRDIFLKAQEGYRAKVIDELDVMLKDAREGRKIRRAISLVEPQEHTKDYDRVIAMLMMSVEEQVEISEHEFAQYVQDEWGWSKEFYGTTRAYTEKE